MAIYNLDTSIWLDYYEKRGNNGVNALKLILKIIKDKSMVIYSDLHIKELKDLGYNLGEINILLRIVKPDNLRRVHISREQKEEATLLAYNRDIPRGDALHAILARDNNSIMVSRDMHFQRLLDVVKTKRPEELF